MYQPFFRPLAWLSLFIFAWSPLATAYRPVQFVKHFGDNGHADQEFSLTQYFNETTQQSDLYVRMGTFRYDGSHLGWSALGLGPMMTGALMFMTYGDPKAPGGPMTLTVRTATGHHPPRPINELKDFYSGAVPEIDVITSQFFEYSGKFFHEKLNKKPSHLGVAEFIVRGYERWTAGPATLSNSSTAQALIWSSNFKQGFDQGDYSVDRALDMHQFGLGFGFVWADLANAAIPEPGFGPISDLEGHKGISEIGPPAPPTHEELAYGDIILAGSHAANIPAAPEPVSSTAPSTTPSAIPSTTPLSPESATQPGPDNGSPVEQPVKNAKQWNIRSVMWHLHGFLMVLGFMVFYPFGIYMLRSPRPTAFQLHWTMNSLGSISVFVSAAIGYMNSHSISITHQYLGIALVVAVAAQLLLGWRHHVAFLATKHTTWMATVHVWLGRIALPLGLLNIIFGLLLRRYGWFTIGITVAVMTVEVVGLALVLGKARGRASHHPLGGAADKHLPPTADEAEEYFQLAGDDDDEFSDDEDTVANTRQTKEEEKRAQHQRLARMDKV